MWGRNEVGEQEQELGIAGQGDWEWEWCGETGIGAGETRMRTWLVNS